ncbi:CNP1-like family protein [Thiocystis violacea]|uniref:CNP1-like family protein n=1 Tax=Thiocystis violacea TaxID=13725 RepID=UPI001905D5AB|nr:CNP1-like family protein [Thiocystis violacea]MBK1723491.1 hypothetical protein [Thiocystis violacea]
MKHVPAICLLLSWTLSSLADDSPFIHEPKTFTPSSVEPGTPWKEATSRLPPWPRDADLIEFELDGPADAFRYFIDGKHLEIGPDRVVRFTLVAQASNGTRNLSFEGIRCTLKGQYKVYAYGAAGHFMPLEQSDWQSLSDLSAEPYRRDLWRYHFCVPRETAPRPKKDMLRSLTGHISPRQNTGFQAD